MKLLSDEDKIKELGIDKLSEEEAKYLLLFAIQELEPHIICDQCNEFWTCDVNFRESRFYIQCQKALIRRLKMKLYNFN